MPKAPRKLTPKSRPDPTAPASPHVTFNPIVELARYVPGAALLLGVPPSPTPGPLRNLRKYVYHLSQDQVEALRAPHDSTINPENFPWSWSSGVFERLEAGKRAVPRGTVKITIEMPGSYSSIEMPRDLLVRDDAELARMALEEQGSDDESSGLSDLDDDDDTDSELSELEDEQLEGRAEMEKLKEAEKEKANYDESDSELSELDDEMFEGPGMEFLHARWPAREDDEDQEHDEDQEEDQEDDEE